MAVSGVLEQEVTFVVQHGGPSGLDAIEVNFDDERAVASAGIALVATLAQRLGTEQLIDETVDPGDRPGAGLEGATAMSLVSAMALGADCIDDCDLLRSGRTADVFGHRILAPSTLARSCGRSRSGTSASSTVFSAGSSRAPGRRGPDPVTGGW
jgi:hypothetical protein